MREIVSDQQGELDVQYECGSSARHMLEFVNELDALVAQLNGRDVTVASGLQSARHASLDARNILDQRLRLSQSEEETISEIIEHIIHTNLPLSFDYRTKCLQAAGLVPDEPSAADLLEKCGVEAGMFISIGEKPVLVQDTHVAWYLLDKPIKDGIWPARRLEVSYTDRGEERIRSLALGSDGLPIGLQSFDTNHTR